MTDAKRLSIKDYCFLLGPPLALVFLAMIYMLAALIFKFTPDNPAEKMLETLIEIESGHHIDIYPFDRHLKIYRAAP